MDAHDQAEAPVTEAGGSLADLAGVLTLDRRALEGHLWVVVLLAFVADTHLTYVGLQHGFAEGNPVVAAAVDAAGFAGLVAPKLAVLGIAVLVRRQVPRHGPVIPLGLAIPWVLATALNAVTLT